jgi:predicted Rossmann fold flavoprotein
MAEIAIIGGGASGMVAAIVAARLGASVCIFEKKDRIGRKLLSTGNGRCNLSNRDMHFSHYHGSVAALLPQLWPQMGEERIRQFWQELGIDYTEGDAGKLFPRSLQAASVLNVLRRELAALSVEIVTKTLVTQIRHGRSEYLLEVKSEEAPFKRKNVAAKAVLLCAGGKAYPKLGADGEGAELARRLQMQVSPLRPALCRLKLQVPYLKRLAGLKRNVPAALWIEGECRQRETGEILFTDQGVSGPAVLNLSRSAGEALQSGRRPVLTLDLVPEMEKGALFVYLLERKERLGGFSAEEALEGWLPKTLIPVALAESGLSPRTGFGSLDKKEIGALAQSLKQWEMPVLALGGWEEAQITVGGVEAGEITAQLESRRHKGLFMAGEVLDLDGDCGGYNLQWAAGSAMIAAEAAAEYVKRAAERKPYKEEQRKIR